MSAEPAAAGGGERPEAEDLLGHGLMLFAVLIFGVNYVVGRWAVGEVPAYTLGFTRWTVGALVVLPFAWTHVRRDAALVRGGWRMFAVAGFSMPFMGAGLTYVALNYTTAINGSVIQTSLPVAIVLLSWIFLREVPSRIQWIGAAIAVAGVLHIVSRGDPAALLGLAVNPGDALLVFCNLGLAAYGVAVRKLPRGIHSLTLLVVVCALGAAFHAPFFAAEILTGQIPRPSAAGIASLAFVAVFPSAVAIICWNTAIVRIGLNRSGFYMYLVPAFATVLAILFLGEEMGLFHLVGLALIVAGVTLSARKG